MRKPCCKSDRCIDLGIEGKRREMQAMSDGGDAKDSKQRGERQKQES